MPGLPAISWISSNTGALKQKRLVAGCKDQLIREAVQEMNDTIDPVQRLFCGKAHQVTMRNAVSTVDDLAVDKSLPCRIRIEVVQADAAHEFLENRRRQVTFGVYNLLGVHGEHITTACVHLP